jgi:hypothetical protein
MPSEKLTAGEVAHTGHGKRVLNAFAVKSMTVHLFYEYRTQILESKYCIGRGTNTV